MNSWAPCVRWFAVCTGRDLSYLCLPVQCQYGAVSHHSLNTSLPSVVLENETLWRSQKQLIELFGKAKVTLSEHFEHIFVNGGLQDDSVIRFYRTTAVDGKPAKWSTATATWC